MRFKNKLFSTKNKIFLSFILFSLIVVIIEKNLEGIFYEFVYPKYFEKEEDYATGLPGNIYFILSILIIVIAAIVLYKLTSGILQKESEKRIKEQNLMYAAIAHDLKTPMTSVQGFAKALSEGKVSDTEKKEIYDIIYAKSNTMNDMINTLFEYSKLGTQEYKPIPESFDICSLVRDIVAENYAEFEKHGIELDIDIPDEEIIVNADKKELARAIANLVVNVYKHNPEGIKAKISVEKAGEKAVIKILDTGAEIPQDMDIFEPFVTENTSRMSGHGTGLGLAITKRIIERNGGKIYISSREEGYTKAFVVQEGIQHDK
ncbi:MAG: HAMP domain-containing histidine kinase [Lachnospiraceae bacterium]|nr:HAMP domain-containing histidine kinase [Lachnospiraceae bacterium]